MTQNSGFKFSYVVGMCQSWQLLPRYLTIQSLLKGPVVLKHKETIDQLGKLKIASQGNF